MTSTSIKDEQTTISIAPGIQSTAGLEASAGTSAAGVAVHEGQHGIDETTTFKGRDPVTNQERFDTERRAFTTESYVEQALGFKDTGLYPLNDANPSPNGWSNPTNRAWNQLTPETAVGVTPW